MRANLLPPSKQSVSAHIQRSGERSDQLDSLRGLAALSVVLGHSIYSIDWGSSSFFWKLDRSPISIAWDGESAVVIFFILSGYVLAQPWLLRRAPSYLDFIIKRAFRIYLPLVLVACLCWLSRVYVAPNLSLAASDQSATKALLHNIFLTGEHNFLNPPGWSLIEEMRISSVFPLLVVPVILLPWQLGLLAAMLLSVLGFIVDRFK